MTVLVVELGQNGLIKSARKIRFVRRFFMPMLAATEMFFLRRRNTIDTLFAGCLDGRYQTRVSLVLSSFEILMSVFVVVDLACSCDKALTLNYLIYCLRNNYFY